MAHLACRCMLPLVNFVLTGPISSQPEEFNCPGPCTRAPLRWGQPEVGGLGPNSDRGVRISRLDVKPVSGGFARMMCLCIFWCLSQDRAGSCVGLPWPCESVCVCVLPRCTFCLSLCFCVHLRLSLGMCLSRFSLRVSPCAHQPIRMRVSADTLCVCSRACRRA